MRIQFSILKASLSVAFLVVVAPVHNCLGIEIPFFDDFGDGNAEDGMPVTWSPAFRSDVTVEDSDLVISGTKSSGPFATVADLDLDDTSIRTRVRLLEGDFIAVGARWEGGQVPDSYYGLIWASGDVSVGLSGGDALDTAATDFDVTREDVMIQLDVIENSISMWAWPPGETRPFDPLVQGIDETRARDTGNIYLWVAEVPFQESPQRGVFRDVRVSNVSIPADPDMGEGLQAGDADMDCDFDQLDLVRVLQAGKYLTGEPATWAEGDWNGAPGGSPGSPPPGDGVFDQLDIIKALATVLYMTGPSAAIRPEANAGEAHASVDLGDVDLAYAPVPEPASIFLLSLGVLALACTCCRLRGRRPF